VPNLVNLPAGCKFAPRCKARVNYELAICNDIEPDLVPVQRDHAVRCWLYLDHEEHRAPLRASEAHLSGVYSQPMEKDKA
jgi:hypothetical protein